jgi:tRNA(Ile)-lysidine synthase
MGRADGLIELPRTFDARTLAAALLCAAGTSTPPRGERLSALLVRIRAGEAFTATLAGARIEAGETIIIGRDPGRAGLPEVETTPGQGLVWDGRFELVAEGAAVVPAAGRMAKLSTADRAALAALSAWARPTLPVHLLADGAVKLAQAVPLSFPRLRAALGQVTKESDI